MTWAAQIEAGLERIARKLEERGADVAIRKTDDRVAERQGGPSREYCFAPRREGSFEVKCLLGTEEAIVSFSSWHQHCDADRDSPANVVKLIALGLSDLCKLEVRMAGKKEYAWKVYSRRGESWVPHSTTALVLFPWFSKRRVVSYSNDALPWDESLWTGSESAQQQS